MPPKLRSRTRSSSRIKSISEGANDSNILKPKSPISKPQTKGKLRTSSRKKSVRKIKTPKITSSQKSFTTDDSDQNTTTDTISEISFSSNVLNSDLNHKSIEYPSLNPEDFVDQSFLSTRNPKSRTSELFVYVDDSKFADLLTQEFPSSENNSLSIDEKQLSFAYSSIISSKSPSIVLKSASFENYDPDLDINSSTTNTETENTDKSQKIIKDNSLVSDLSDLSDLSDRADTDSKRKKTGKSKPKNSKNAKNAPAKKSNPAKIEEKSSSSGVDVIPKKFLTRSRTPIAKINWLSEEHIINTLPKSRKTIELRQKEVKSQPEKLSNVSKTKTRSMKKTGSKNNNKAKTQVSKNASNKRISKMTLNEEQNHTESDSIRERIKTKKGSKEKNNFNVRKTAF
ncbi:hypothetical protein BB560_007344 [Smittium megazygosporum]|uniref:Uncharacterized protein n=1 Tax=Smittium megazygosporum TaxID=133381 RepID=A0A2T9XWM5_9FUNG|nr:hypothetical protein BB560_007344 [Smittium megazygosporum]